MNAGISLKGPATFIEHRWERLPVYSRGTYVCDVKECNAYNKHAFDILFVLVQAKYVTEKAHLLGMHLLPPLYLAKAPFFPFGFSFSFVF